MNKILLGLSLVLNEEFREKIKKLLKHSRSSFLLLDNPQKPWKPVL